MIDSPSVDGHSLAQRFMTELDQLGSFYLGRRHDLATGQTDNSQPILYDSRDLTTHAVCVGMTGSGKTGLCLSLLEEAALDGIPAIAIDPKGDLGNLLLAFPSLVPADFRPWVDPGEAARKQMSADEFAANQAALWRDGLAKWDQGPERIHRFCDAVDRVIYTPGSSAGIPITVLKSFHVPPAEIIADNEQFHEHIAAAASGLLALLGIDADPIRSREHIFLSTVFESAWRDGQDLDLPSLIRQMLQPPFSKIGVVDLESFYPADERTKLSMQLNNLLASPSFASWLDGEPLDIQRLLYTPEGRPRLAIISIAHLDEAQRMFFVTILLNEIVSWIRTQPGTNSLRAILYMDEVFGYFPPIANPPSKRPMLTLLKQGRAYGLGCVLATQNPVDLDYKGLSNAGTWFLGRLQTERDKARVIEGLEGASAQAGSTFNRGEMEAKLAALASRVFLMNNVHEDAPQVFHTRWAMSYLRGPLTRDQIKTLMDPMRAKLMRSNGAASERLAAAAGQGGEASSTDPDMPHLAASNKRPILPAAIREAFVAINERVPEGYRLEYRPGLYGAGKLHFRRASDNIDEWRDCFVLQTIHDTPPNDIWEGAYVYPEDFVFEQHPDDRGQFADLPTELAREKNYSIFKRHIEDHLYRTKSLPIWKCEALDEVSRPDESEQSFRARLHEPAASRHQAELKDVETKHAANLADVEADIQRYRAKVRTERWQFFARVGGLVWVAAETALRALGKGRRGRPRSAGAAFGYAASEHGQHASAQTYLKNALKAKERLMQQRQSQLNNLEMKYRTDNLQLESLELKPLKSDIDVDQILLAWLPWRIDGDGAAEPVYHSPTLRAEQTPAM
jgi:hypothetical protein